ncbi:MAG: hypothetical protein WC610_01010 [Patescibacteria group bacterium]
MAVPVYTIPELTTMNTGEATTNWAEPGTWLGGGLPVAETDYFIQGTGCIDKTFNAVAIGGLMYSAGAQTIASPNAYFAWVWFGCPNAIDTLANGGIRLMVGDLNTVFKAWYVLGSNTYQYGGWRCIPVDPNTTADATIGTPSGVWAFFGMAASVLNAVAKGNPCAIDVIRHGRGTLQSVSGEAANYATFAGAAAQDQNVTNRWGLCQLIDGTVIQQGHFLMGVAATAVDFRDSNRAIVIANTTKVTSTFNLFEIRNATSRVDWTSISFTALGTVSRGDFTVTDNATINWIGCTFTDVGLFVLQAATIVTSCVFRRTDRITLAGATLTSCTIDNNRATTAVLAATPAGAQLVSGCTFTSDGTGHGLEITGAAVPDMTLTNCTWTNYTAASGGNEAVYVNIASGTMNLNISGGTTPSVRTAGCNVTVVSGAVNVTINVKNSAGTNIENARVFVKASDNIGPFPFEETVTISNSGTTATVTHTAHGMTTNDKVVISGATSPTFDANNGIFSITYVSDNSYTYAMLSAPGDGAVPGTIISTFVAISGTTNASGNISMSRVFLTNQNIIGWVRKTSTPPTYTPPNYKTGPIGGTVNSTTGFTANVQLISDD